MVLDKVQKNGKDTIFAVSEKAGVSVVTVSRVFNNYTHVSEKTRNLVLAAAREVHYKPRVISKRPVIAVLVAHLDQITAGDYKSRLGINIVRAANRRGYLVEFIPVESIEMATQGLVDGIIEIGLTTSELNKLKNLPDVPKVCTNNLATDKSWYSMCSDHASEATIATRHLMDHGHKRIALVLDELRGWGPEQRQKGYTEALRKRYGQNTKLHIFSAELLTAEQISAKIIEAECTAAILLSDNSGMAVLDALTNGIKKSIPEDISIIALENESVSQFMSPRLTTIIQPLESMAEEAVLNITESAKRRQPKLRKLKSRLIVRDSVRSI